VRFLFGWIEHIENLVPTPSTLSTQKKTKLATSTCILEEAMMNSMLFGSRSSKSLKKKNIQGSSS